MVGLAQALVVLEPIDHFENVSTTDSSHGENIGNSWIPRER